MNDRKRTGRHRRDQGVQLAEESRSPSGHQTEYELKLAVPDAAWEAVTREVLSGNSSALALHAVYFDTPDARLSAHGIALRVRREGKQWIQTLKAPGGSLLDRIEDEIPLRSFTRRVPIPDLFKHAGPAADAICTALGSREAKAPALHPRFEVKVQRRLRRIEHNGTEIEVALDEGELLAAGRRQVVRELEFELKQGDPAELLRLARQWRERWALWVLAASKAQRGALLAAGEMYGVPIGARVPSFERKPARGAFVGAVLDSCLRQVLGNASEIAAGSQGDDHVHQLRVGLRRLRTVMRELPSLHRQTAHLEPALVVVFRALGERRDRGHVLRTIGPQVEHVGGPPLRIPPGFHEGADPGEVVRGSAFQDALLELLERSGTVRSDVRAGVRRLLASRLDQLHRDVTHDGRDFTRLDEELQHRARKRVKRLRYLGEFASSLYRQKDVERYLCVLKSAQEALGQYNDGLMALSLYEELAANDAGAQFGVEFLRARRVGEAKVCRKALKRLGDTPRFWR